MVINFNQEQSRKLELYSLWCGEPFGDRARMAATLERLIDLELAKVRQPTPTQPEKGASDVKGA